MINLQYIANEFNFVGSFVSGIPFGNGHINDTFLIKCNNGTTDFQYIIQKINNKVFPNVAELMNNIVLVTNYINNLPENCNPNNTKTLQVIKTKSGDNFLIYKNKYYRAYKYIDNSVSLNTATTQQFYECGRIFGDFQALLKDFPSQNLFVTIPNFHNTQKRYLTLIKAIKKDSLKRANLCKKEIDFINARYLYFSKIVNKLNMGVIPTRVIHNDTKLNNVLFNSDGTKATTVLDLDTVMSGSLLYDFGDAIRYGCNTAKEDEKNLKKVQFSLPLFKSYTQGYIHSLKDILTQEEIKLLPFSAILITLECGMRFLTDYLKGDKYFKTNYANHNLVRAKAQLKLAKEMERKFKKMQKIVADLIV